MPTFRYTKCNRKTKAEYEISCTGSAKRNVEKPPNCCGQPMIAIIED